jgi:hypothetical protein
MSNSRLVFLSLVVFAIIIGGGYLVFHQLGKPQLAKPDPVAAVEPDFTHDEADQAQSFNPVKQELDPSVSLSSNPDPMLYLEQLMRRDSDGLVSAKGAGDHTIVHLQGRYTHMSAGVRDPETGEMLIQCFTGYNELKETVAGTRQPTRKAEGNGEVASF